MTGKRWRRSRAWAWMVVGTVVVLVGATITGAIGAYRYSYDPSAWRATQLRGTELRGTRAARAAARDLDGASRGAVLETLGPADHATEAELTYHLHES